MLPIKSRSRVRITEVSHLLQPHFPQITEAWRRRMAEEFAFDERVLSVLERLSIASGANSFVGRIRRVF